MITVSEGLPPTHPLVLEFHQIYRTYQETGYHSFQKTIFRNILLWCFFILPAGLYFFENGGIRLITWLSIIALIIYGSAERHFAPRLYQLHEKILPHTKNEYAEGYYRDSIRILRAVYKEKSVLQYIVNWLKMRIYLKLSEDPAVSDEKNPIKASKRSERLDLLTKPSFFFGIGIIYLVCIGSIIAISGTEWGITETWDPFFNFIQTIVLIAGISLFLLTLIPIIALLFANMKVLHHISFWEYAAEHDAEIKPIRYQIIGELLIANNLFCSLIVLLTGFLLSPIPLCFSVLLYSSTYPDDYYQYVKSKHRWANRGNLILTVGFFFVLLIAFFIQPKETQDFIQFWLHSTSSLPIFLITGLVVVIGVGIVFNAFLHGTFSLPKDFQEFPIFFRPLGTTNSQITLSRIIFFGIFFLYSFILAIGISINGIIEVSFDSAPFRIVGFAVICFFVVRQVITVMYRVWALCQNVGDLMITYTWKHKQEELKVHYWEFVNSPTGLVFPGVLTLPMLIHWEKIATARTFFLNYPGWLQSMALVWFVLTICILGYLVGVVVFWTILAPHFVWHALALTTIPREEIPSIQQLPIFSAFRKNLQQLYEWGFIGLPGLFLLYIPTVTGVFTVQVIGSMIGLAIFMFIGLWAISFFLPRFLNNILHIIEERTEETMDSDYGKKKTLST